MIGSLAPDSCRGGAMAPTAESPLAPEKLRAFLRHGVRFLDRTWRKRVMLAYVREFGLRGHIG